MNIEHTKTRWIEKRFGYLTKTCTLDPGPAIRRATEEWYESAEAELCAEVESLRVQISLALEYHRRENSTGRVKDFCTECGQEWPCDTRTTLEAS